MEPSVISASYLSLIIVLSVLCLTAICFYICAVCAAIAFLQESLEKDPHFQPPVTVLKPLCGIDGELYVNLVSFCQQEYPTYQIIFSVRESADPAIAVVRQIMAEFPDLDLELVISDRLIGTNLKVSNLANARAGAKYPILVIADSDIRVRSNYLKEVIQPFKDSQVGVVTCPYNSLPTGWIAAFEALEVSTQFQPRVLTAKILSGIKFAFGSTIAIRQDVLDEIGGFRAIADYLADDFKLGNLPSRRGYQVVLSHHLVSHTSSQVNLREFLSRQIRWAKCIKVETLGGYLGLIFTQGTLTSLSLLLGTGGSQFSWLVLAVVWSSRLFMGWLVGAIVLKDPVAKKFFWLMPLRDLVSSAIWCYSLFAGDLIEWRGQKMLLTTGGKLVALKEGSLNFF